MSTTQPAAPMAEAVRVGQPSERRTLVALLAALEALLLAAASVLEYLYAPQPVPVNNLSGGVQTGWTLYGCVQPLTPPSGGVPSAPYPCPSPNNASQVALLIALVCALVALLVLPAILGWLSRRWQTALAAPCIPVWLALLILVALALVPSLGAATGPASGFVPGNYYPTTLAVSVAGPLLSALAVAAGLGGLGWLARRAFAQ